MYTDTQTRGVSHISGYPRIVQGSLGILGVCGYLVGRGWTSLDSLDSQNIQGILGVHGCSDAGC